jgi:hypothetical protein
VSRLGWNLLVVVDGLFAFSLVGALFAISLFPAELGEPGPGLALTLLGLWLAHDIAVIAGVARYAWRIRVGRRWVWAGVFSAHVLFVLFVASGAAWLPPMGWPAVAQSLLRLSLWLADGVALFRYAFREPVGESN